MPSGATYLEVYQVSRGSDGQITATKAPYLRDWRRFRAALSDLTEYRVVDRTATNIPALAYEITHFVGALDNLKNGQPNPRELDELRTRWELLKVAILANTFPNYTPQELTEKVLAIANEFGVYLEGELPTLPSFVLPPVPANAPAIPVP